MSVVGGLRAVVVELGGVVALKPLALGVQALDSEAARFRVVLERDCVRLAFVEVAHALGLVALGRGLHGLHLRS